MNPMTTDRLQNVNSTMSMSVTHYWIGHGVLENQIQALSRTFRHRFEDFQGPARTLVIVLVASPVVIAVRGGIKYVSK